jgi:hypothetical protein
VGSISDPKYEFKASFPNGTNAGFMLNTDFAVVQTTRLGGFSPLGRLLTIGSFLITEVVNISWLLFSRQKLCTT